MTLCSCSCKSLHSTRSTASVPGRPILQLRHFSGTQLRGSNVCSTSKVTAHPVSLSNTGYSWIYGAVRTMNTLPASYLVHGNCQTISGRIEEKWYGCVAMLVRIFGRRVFVHRWARHAAVAKQRRHKWQFCFPIWLGTKLLALWDLYVNGRTYDQIFMSKATPNKKRVGLLISYKPLSSSISSLKLPFTLHLEFQSHFLLLSTSTPTLKSN
jgi:hypothetical protein